MDSFLSGTSTATPHSSSRSPSLVSPSLAFPQALGTPEGLLALPTPAPWPTRTSFPRKNVEPPSEGATPNDNRSGSCTHTGLPALQLLILAAQEAEARQQTPALHGTATTGRASFQAHQPARHAPVLAGSTFASSPSTMCSAKLLQSLLMLASGLALPAPSLQCLPTPVPSSQAGGALWADVGSAQRALHPSCSSSCLSLCPSSVLGLH